jgi:hypothetical protein
MNECETGAAVHLFKTTHRSMTCRTTTTTTTVTGTTIVILFQTRIKPTAPTLPYASPQGIIVKEIRIDCIMMSTSTGHAHACRHSNCLFIILRRQIYMYVCVSVSVCVRALL